MRAIVQHVYGFPDALELRELDDPVPRDNEVHVRVRASSVNAGDWFFLTGRPYPLRLWTGLFRPRARFLGMDFAGEVRAVGRRVTRFRPGDEVYGQLPGSYAEHVCVREDRMAIKPRNLTFEQAAAVPVAALAALQGLRDRGRVKPGHAVLINGASGGVGTFAVQIARALGAEVTGVCSTQNVEQARALGAHHVIDYTREDFTRTTERYDSILDLAGSAPLPSCTRLLKPTGVYVSSVGRTGRSLLALLASLVPGSKVALHASRSTPEALGVLRDMIETGKVTPVIERRYSLDEVPEALRRQGAGHARGKSVVVV